MEVYKKHVVVGNREGFPKNVVVKDKEQIPEAEVVEGGLRWIPKDVGGNSLETTKIE